MTTLRPRVTVSQRVVSSYLTPTAKKTAAMIGVAQWGEINRVQLVTTLSEFISYFGDDNSTGLTGIRGANEFFRNGGKLKFIRIADSSTRAKSTKTFQNSGAVDVITFEALYYGTYGDNISITIEANGSNVDITITDGTTIEVFNNSGAGYADCDAIVSAISGNSSLVDVSLAGATGSEQPAAISATYLTGGNNGTAVSISDYTTAFDNLLLVEEFDYLLTPGITSDSDCSTLAARMESRATNEKKYGRFVSGIALNESYATTQARTTHSKRFTLVAPNLKTSSRYDDSDLTLDGSYLACAFVGKLCSMDYGEDATHKTILVNGVSIDTTTNKEYYTKSEQETMLSYGTTPITLIGNSIQVVRDITTISDQTSIYLDGSIMDIVDYVTASLQDYLSTGIGKPNTSVVRRIYATGCDSLLSTFKNNGVIEEYQNTSIIEGASSTEMAATVTMKPTYGTKFIDLLINVE